MADEPIAYYIGASHGLLSITPILDKHTDKLSGLLAQSKALEMTPVPGGGLNPLDQRTAQLNQKGAVDKQIMDLIDLSSTAALKQLGKNKPSQLLIWPPERGNLPSQVVSAKTFEEMTKGLKHFSGVTVGGTPIPE